MLTVPNSAKYSPDDSLYRVNFMDPAEIGAIATLLAASLAIIGLGAAAIYRMGKITQETADLKIVLQGETRRLDEKNDIQFAHVEQQFRDMDRKFEQRFDDMDHKFDQRFKQVDQRFDDIDRKFDQRFNDMDRRFTELLELIRSENERTRGQIQQLSTIIMSHSHDTDGSVIFRVPPPPQEE